MSTVTPNLGLFKYNTSTDANSAFNINTALNNNWDIIDEALAGGGGSSRNIGEIVASSLPLVDAGLHLLDGSLIQGSGIYSAFVTYIAGLVSTYPDLFVSESDWQTSVSTYGVCGKFVYDSTNNTVRLPKITGIIEGTTDVTALGDLVEAGLPNITGSLTYAYWSSSGDVSGAFAKVTATMHSSNDTKNENNAIQTLSIDASNSNSIYGNSTTVQPQSIKALYYIVVATSTKTNIQVDIDEIATDLNGKCDKADLQECQVIIETYQNGTSWYRVWSDGWCEQGGRTPLRSSNSWQTINLLKNFNDTNYTVTLSIMGSQTNNESSCLNNMTVSSFMVYGWENRGNGWYACGYTEV